MSCGKRTIKKTRIIQTFRCYSEQTTCLFNTHCKEVPTNKWTVDTIVAIRTIVRIVVSLSYLMATIITYEKLITWLYRCTGLMAPLHAARTLHPSLCRRFYEKISAVNAVEHRIIGSLCFCSRRMFPGSLRLTTICLINCFGLFRLRPLSFCLCV